MTHSMGTLDFFLLEAGEYLERLDALAQTPAGAFTAPEELVRIARAFRGSALMANQHGLARAAQGLESAARAVREGRLTWDERARGEIIRAVDDVKVLMRRLREPYQGDTEKAEQIGVALDRLSGRASAALRAQAGSGLDAGGRAFVAREAAAIASTLQRAAQALAANPAAREALGPVAPSMSALRGVAAINDLPPLAEVLGAVEGAVKEVHAHGGPVGEEVPPVFEAAALALARAAREVVDRGRPDPGSEEARTFAGRLLRAFTGPAVPIETLFYNDAGPHVVQPGRAPAGGAGFARVELVSHGEFLQAAATELRRAATPVQRDLRLFAIAAALRPMVGAAGGPLAGAVGRLAEAARDAIGRGAASMSSDAFAASIREAADALCATHSGDETLLGERVAQAAEHLAALQLELPAPAAAAPPAVAAAPAPAPAVEAAPAPLPPTPAPVEAVAPPLAAAAVVPPPPAPPPPVEVAPPPPVQVAPPPAPVAAAPPQPAPPPERPRTTRRVEPAAAVPLREADLATSYLTLEQLIAERGLPLGTLAELLAGATPPPAAAAAAPAPAGLPAAEPDVVPIESLLYRGERALRRALELKPQLLSAAREPGDARLQALLTEVLDLVELGLGAGR